MQAAPTNPTGSAMATTPLPLQLGLLDAAAASLAEADPLHFAHPAADREVRLDGHRVAYALRRARRRTIGFVVDAEGLRVSAPRWVGATEVEAALHARAGWILRKLREQRDRARRTAQARVTWCDGARLPFLGATVVVRLDARVSGVVLDAVDGLTVGAAPDALPLRVGLPPDVDARRLREAVQGWLQRQALRVFQTRCADYAVRLGVRVRRIALSSATTRWGSASADGSIRLNWRLVHFGMPVIDYVVAHELAHLREMNHSPAFWEVVRSVIPDVDAARGALRAQVLPEFDDAGA
jgi:predicted metal-dependent hydrolase